MYIVGVSRSKSLFDVLEARFLTFHDGVSYVAVIYFLQKLALLNDKGTSLVCQRIEHLGTDSGLVRIEEAMEETELLH